MPKFAVFTSYLCQKNLSQSKHEEFEPNSALKIRDQKERRAENAKKLDMPEIWQGEKFLQPALFILRNFSSCALCNCGHYPIHGPARLAFKWKEKCEKKMWVDFRVLENPSQRRNGFTLESPLTFIFIFKWGKPSKNKNPNDSSMEKSGLRKLDF